MITEDYVSFEVAKLLKEKGFPQEYDVFHSMIYNEEDFEDEYEVQRMVLQTRLVKAGTLSSYPVGVPEPKCYCPTLQMAMKWLREEHNLHVDSSIYTDTDGDSEHEYTYTYWDWLIFNSESGRRIAEPQIGCGRYDSYEQACEAAIKYCLENLI